MVARSGERIEILPNADSGMQSWRYHACALRGWNTKDSTGSPGDSLCGDVLAAVAPQFALQRTLGVRYDVPRREATGVAFGFCAGIRFVTRLFQRDAKPAPPTIY